MSDVEAFIEALNDLQRDHGLYVGWHPSGLTLHDDGFKTHENRIGYLLDTGSEDHGAFKTELYIRG